MRERAMRREPVFDDDHHTDHDYDDSHARDTRRRSPLRSLLAPARSLPLIGLIAIIIAFVTNALYLQHGNRAALFPDLVGAFKQAVTGASSADNTAVPAPPRRPDPVDASIASAERALLVLGYFSGAIDGLKSPVFHDALMRFQKERKLTMSGELDALTKAQLAKASGLPVD